MCLVAQVCFALRRLYFGQMAGLFRSGMHLVPQLCIAGGRGRLTCRTPKHASAGPQVYNRAVGVEQASAACNTTHGKPVPAMGESEALCALQRRCMHRTPCVSIDTCVGTYVQGWSLPTVACLVRVMPTSCRARTDLHSASLSQCRSWQSSSCARRHLTCVGLHASGKTCGTQGHTKAEDTQSVRRRAERTRAVRTCNNQGLRNTTHCNTQRITADTRRH